MCFCFFDPAVLKNIKKQPVLLVYIRQVLKDHERSYSIITLLSIDVALYSRTN